MDKSSLGIPIELETRRWMLGLTHSEVVKSVFNETKINKMTSIYTPGYWEIPNLMKN